MINLEKNEFKNVDGKIAERNTNTYRLFSFIITIRFYIFLLVEIYKTFSSFIIKYNNDMILL